MGVVGPIDMICMGVVEPMGVVEQDPDARDESPFCDILSLQFPFFAFLEVLLSLKLLFRSSLISS